MAVDGTKRPELLQLDVLNSLLPPMVEHRQRWTVVDPYLARHLAAHAARAEVLDELLLEPGFAASVDPDHLAPLLDPDAPGPAGKMARIYLRALDRLRAATPAERAAILEQVAQQQSPEVAERFGVRTASWRTRWARWQRSAHHQRLPAPAAPLGLAAATVDGQPLVVTGGEDGAVYVWIWGTSPVLADRLAGHDGPVNAVALAEVDGDPLIASAGADGRALLWDVRRGRLVAGTGEREAPFDAVAIGAARRGALVAAAGSDGRVVAWDVDDLRWPVLAARDGGDTSALAVGGGPSFPFVAYGDAGGSVRLLYARATEPLTIRAARRGPVDSLAAATMDDRSILVWAADRAVTMWDVSEIGRAHV